MTDTRISRTQGRRFQPRGEGQSDPLGPARRKYMVVVALCLGAATIAVALRDHIVLRDLGEGFALAAAATVVMGWPILRHADSGDMARLIAFVGCDGSGKSTLSRDALDELGGERPAVLLYLGLGSGTLGQRIKRLPLVGRVVEARLSRKAKQARDATRSIPGLPTALVVYALSLLRLRRFRRMLAMRRAGVTVLTDRYPQIEVPGFYDGPGLSAGWARTRAVAALARKEREMYAWMASFHPDVIIRLNIDAETAYARKPDHDLELLARKTAVTSLLRFGGAPIVDLDSTQPYPVVRSMVRQAISSTLKDERRGA